jgi:biopolymer transport protein ExbB/TolQ
MFEWITITLLIIAVIYLAKRLAHLEKIVRWVEIQSNNNAININALSAMHDSESYAKNHPELTGEEIAAMQTALRSDSQRENSIIKDRNEHLKTLGVAGGYIY